MTKQFSNLVGALYTSNLTRLSRRYSAMNCGSRSFGYAQDFGSRLSSQPALKRQLKGRENASSFSRRLFWLITLLTFAACLTNFPAQAETHAQVLTRAYDNQRTGANLSEKALKPSN